MKFECNPEKLKEILTLVEKMTSKNPTLPVLKTVYLHAGQKKLLLRATNLSVGIECEIPAVVTTEGDTTIDGSVLLQICANSTNTKTLSFEKKGEVIHTQTGRNSSILTCFQTEEFPTLPIIEGEEFVIQKKLLQEGIRSVFFAVATTEIKPEIASVYIYSENETLYFVGTDSFRLAEKKYTQKGIADMGKILIPYKNIGDVLRTLDMMPEQVSIQFTRSQLSIHGGGMYFTTRLIDGGFPTYQMIIPKESKTTVVVLRQDLLQTLRLSSVFTDVFSHITMSISPKEKEVSFSSKNTTVGSTNTTIEAVITGEEITVVFNLKYFLDVFQTLSGDSVSLSFTEPHKPICIQGVGDKNFLYLLMPTNK